MVKMFYDLIEHTDLSAHIFWFQCVTLQFNVIDNFSFIIALALHFNLVLW